jgi:hypothetical protein
MIVVVVIGAVDNVDKWLGASLVKLKFLHRPWG